MRMFFALVKLALLGAALVTMTGCSTVPPLPPKAAELNRAGAEALANGDLELASARLNVAIEYSPRFTEAWVNLGLVEMKKGNLEKALKDLGKARSLNPDLAAPHHALGVLDESRRKTDGADKHYRAALKVDPGFVSSRANLGRLLFARGAFEEAKVQFLRLTEVAPQEIAGFAGLVECLIRLGREGEADDVLAKARARFGDTEEFLLLYGRQLLRRGVFVDAEQVFASVTASSDAERRASAWAWVAVARLERNELSAARVAATESQKIDSKNPVAGFVARRVAVR